MTDSMNLENQKSSIRSESALELAFFGCQLMFAELQPLSRTVKNAPFTIFYLNVNHYSRIAVEFELEVKLEIIYEIPKFAYFVTQIHTFTIHSSV
jgi:hypothetical protein